MIYHVIPTIPTIAFWGFFPFHCDLYIIDPSWVSQKEGQYLQLFHLLRASSNFFRKFLWSSCLLCPINYENFESSPLFCHICIWVALNITFIQVTLSLQLFQLIFFSLYKFWEKYLEKGTGTKQIKWAREENQPEETDHWVELVSS